MPTGTSSSSTSNSPDGGSYANMADILSTLKGMGNQVDQLVKQGAALQTNQEQMSRDLAEVRKTGEAVEKRVLVMETRQEERDKASKQIDAMRTEAKSDLKDTKQGFTSGVMWAFGILVTLLSIAIGVLVNVWLHKA